MNKRQNVYRLFYLLSVITLLALTQQTGFAQQAVTQTQPASQNLARTTLPSSPNTSGEVSSSKKDEPPAAGSSKPAPKPQGSSEGKLARWLNLQTANLIAFYRFTETSAGATTYNQLMHKAVLKVSFKFDAEGKYTLNVGGQTGSSFTSSLYNTGIGKGRGTTRFSLRQIYFAARPVRGLEVQAGGLYINRGEGTEITTYDDDGYLMGYRVSVRRPKQFFFDEISVTYAYLGDLKTPNIFRRFNRLGESNYHQFLVAKTFGKRAALSLDYTFQSGVDTAHEALRVNTKELRFVDNIRFENYQRLDGKPDFGFAVRGEKVIARRFTLSGGFARIDRNCGSLNGDRYPAGKRLFSLISYNLRPDLSVNAFVSRAISNDFTQPTRTRVDLFLSYNLLKVLHKTGLF